MLMQNNNVPKTCFWLKHIISLTSPANSSSHSHTLFTSLCIQSNSRRLLELSPAYMHKTQRVAASPLQGRQTYTPIHLKGNFVSPFKVTACFGTVGGSLNSRNESIHIDTVRTLDKRQGPPNLGFKLSQKLCSSRALFHDDCTSVYKTIFVLKTRIYVINWQDDCEHYINAILIKWAQNLEKTLTKPCFILYERQKIWTYVPRSMYFMSVQSRRAFRRAEMVSSSKAGSKEAFYCAP